MNNSLRLDKSFDCGQTASTFYTRASVNRKSILGKSTLQRSEIHADQTTQKWKRSTDFRSSLKNNSFGSFLRKEQKKDVPSNSASEKLKTLAIRVNFSNKYELFQSPKPHKNFVNFLPTWDPKSQECLSLKDKAICDLLSKPDFSIRKLAWNFSHNFQSTHLVVQDVIAKFEGDSGANLASGRPIVATKSQILTQIMPDDNRLKGVFLSQSRSTGSYKTDFSKETKMTIARVLRQSYQLA